jgi:LPXTG-motif cell wall-anchored protein
MIVDYEILVEYFGKNNPVAPIVEGRITVGTEPVKTEAPPVVDPTTPPVVDPTTPPVVEPTTTPAGNEQPVATGQKMPNTATTSYNIVLIGILFVAFGLIFYFRKRRLQA